MTGENGLQCLAFMLRRIEHGDICPYASPFAMNDGTSMLTMGNLGREPVRALSEDNLTTRLGPRRAISRDVRRAHAQRQLRYSVRFGG